MSDLEETIWDPISSWGRVMPPSDFVLDSSWSSFSQTKKNWPERLLPRPSTPQTLTHIWNSFSCELPLSRDTSALCRQKSFLRQNDVLKENGDQRTDPPTGWPRNFWKFQVFDEHCDGLQLLLGRATWAFELQPPAQKTSFVLVFFVFSEVDGWLTAKVDQYPAYGGLWYFAERGKLLPWCRSDNMLDNGGWRDDVPISSPSSSIWISCAVKASDRTN